MKIAISAALAATLAAAPAWAQPTYTDGNGKQTTASPFLPGIGAATAFFNANGGLTQVSPTNPLPTTGSGGGSSTTTPYVQGTATNSATPGAYTQALAADASRTACTVTNTGTGQQSIIQATSQPANGTVSPLPTIAPNGFYSCGGYRGTVWIASTVASDPYGYEGDR